MLARAAGRVEYTFDLLTETNTALARHGHKLQATTPRHSAAKAVAVVALEKKRRHPPPAQLGVGQGTHAHAAPS